MITRLVNRVVVCLWERGWITTDTMRRWLWTTA